MSPIRPIRVAASLALLCPGLLLAVACGGHGSGDAGAVGTRDGGGVDIPSGGKATIGDKVFDENVVQSYYLTFSDEEYAKLMDMSTLLLNPYTVNEDRYVKASLRVGDTEIPSIGVRFKGQFSIWGCVDMATGTRRVRVEPVFRDIDVCQRFSLKLDLDRYDEARAWMV